MDIAGAKALKERLEEASVDPVAPAPAQAPEDAPPLYHWLGLSRVIDGSSTEPDDRDVPAPSVSFFRRLRFSFR